MAQTTAPQRTLIVYYSRSGTTRRVAEALRSLLDCDLEEIGEPRNRGGIFGLIRSLRDGIRKRSAPIDPTNKDPAAYDLVIVGTPVWAWSVASPVRSYLAEHRARLPRVAFFCTMGNTGADGAFGEMRGLVGKSPCGLRAFKAKDVWSGRYTGPLATFGNALRTGEVVKLSAIT